MLKRIIFFVIVFIAFSCIRITPPEVTLSTDEKELEKHIIDSYNKLNADTWMVASVRSTESTNLITESTNLSRVKIEALKARERQKYNMDDISEFKKKGYIGESQTGFLKLLNNTTKIKDPIYKKNLDRIIAEENTDRKSIILWIIDSKDRLTEKDIDMVGHIFGSINIRNAKKGEWIENSQHQWIKKK